MRVRDGDNNVRMCIHISTPRSKGVIIKTKGEGGYAKFAN